MNELKKIKLHGLLWEIVYLIILIGIIAFVFLTIKNKTYRDPKYYTYQDLKEETINYLNNHLNELEETSQLVIQNKSPKCPEYGNFSYCYNESGFVDIFFYDYFKEKYPHANFGGRYWGLIYSQKDILNNKDIEIYDQKKEEGYGDNLFLKVKVKDNWYFYYIDYSYNNEYINDIEKSY